jgi:hypothetical protein
MSRTRNFYRLPDVKQMIADYRCSIGAESLVEPTDVNKNVDAAAAAATLIKLGMTAATPENNDGFQTPNRRH